MSVQKDVKREFPQICNRLMLNPHIHRAPLPTIDALTEAVWKGYPPEIREPFEVLGKWQGAAVNSGDNIVLLGPGGRLNLAKVTRSGRDPTTGWPLFPNTSATPTLNAEDFGPLNDWFRRHRTMIDDLERAEHAIKVASNHLTTWAQYHWAMPKVCRLLANQATYENVRDHANVKSTSQPRIDEDLRYNEEILELFDDADTLASKMFLLEPSGGASFPFSVHYNAS